jgi:hypothetical protein
MINITTTNDNKVIIDDVEYTPSNEILGVYLDITDGTSFILGFEIITKRYSVSEVTLNVVSYNNSLDFKNEYYNILGLSDENIEP